MKSKGNAIFIGIVLAVVGVGVYLLLQKPAEEYLSPPLPIGIAPSEYREKFCPSSLYFDSTTKEASFKISYKNVGPSIGRFIVNINSDNLLTRYENDLEGYRKTSSKSWVVESNGGASYNFRLKINTTENPNNFTVSSQLSCEYDTSIAKNLNCESQARCCKYSREGFVSQYSLISEAC